MEVVSRAQCGPERWDDVVSTSPDGWVWALWSWQELILRVPRWQLTDASFALVDDERVVAVVPLQWSGDRARLSGSGFGLTSPAVAGGIVDADRVRYRSAIFAHVHALAVAGKASRIEFALSPVSDTSLKDPHGANPFVAFGYADESSQSRILDLRPEPDTLLSQCSKDTRQQIKRARASGVIARRVKWIESVDDYYALHSETYRRTGQTPHPREYFEGIANGPGTTGHSVLWGAYDTNGRAIAFHNSARLRNAAMYHTGCSSAAALDSGANYLVFWESILDARSNGIEWYEIGEVFPGADGKKGGLTTFKSKFGGVTHRVFRAGMTLAPPPPTPMPATVEAAPDVVERAGVFHAVRQSLRVTRRLSERLIGSTITNTAARAVVAGAKRLRDGPQRHPTASQRSSVAAVATAASPIRFFRPFWDEAEANAVRLPVTASDRETREANLASQIRRIERFADDTEVVLFSSGRGALHAALQILSTKEPSRRFVIIPSYSCRGLFDAVVNAGLVPRFVDVDADLNADQTAVSRALDEDVLAVIPVHLGGQRFAHERVLSEARSQGVFVIEDKAHAFASGWRLDSDVVMYSFGLGKNVMATTGGAVVSRIHTAEFAALRSTMADEAPEVAIARYDYCRDAYLSDTPGAGGYPGHLRPDYGLSRMNAVDAAILEQQLKKAPLIVSRHRAHAAVAAAALRSHPELFHIQSGFGSHAYTKLIVDLGSPAARDRFLNFTAQHGIEMEWMYVPLHSREFGKPFQTTPLPRTEPLDGAVVNVPVRPDLRDDEVERIAAAIRAFADCERANG